MFLDEHQIKVVAGKGGNGCSSFRREKFVPNGGPNGGDGGNGGNVIIRANLNMNTLSHLAHKKVFKADNGEMGKGKNMHGKNAEDLIIEVPPGTIIFNEDKSQILADLNSGEEITVAHGGIGGHGNARFVSSTNQAPKFAEMGEPGEKRELTLELKLIADIGIIGLPSAGKSTLISVISNAKPKIAAYHFTTLAPNLGVVKHKGKSFVVADIPGLIEGASEGKGLGHQFLKHVSRTKILVHLLDGSLPNIAENYKTIRKELEKFDKTLNETEEILVINKTDILSEEQITEAEKALKKVSKAKHIYKISAVAKTNLDPLLNELLTKVQSIKPKETPITKKLPVLKPHIDKNKFNLDKITEEENHKTFHISGARIEQVAVMTDLSTLEGQERMYYFIEKLGAKKAIERKGATFGDIIKINDKSIPYRK